MHNKKVFVRLLLLIFCLIIPEEVSGEGFVAGILVKTSQGYQPIEQLAPGDSIICYDFKSSCVERPVTHVVKKKTDAIVQLVVNNEIIHVAPDHKFYIPQEQKWIDAQDLKASHVLLSHCTEFAHIDDIKILPAHEYVYDITVADFHNFCVSTNDIHVHNIAFPVIALGITLFFGDTVPVITLSALGAGAVLLGSKLAADEINKRRSTHHDIPYDYGTSRSTHHDTTSYGEESKRTFHEERAPGKPDENDGFIPRKNWDGKKVPNPNGPGFGYPAKDGGVWVPTGENGHGGAHWDVEYPGKKRDYNNVFPGGKVRPGKKNK